MNVIVPEGLKSTALYENVTEKQDKSVKQTLDFTFNEPALKRI